MVPFEFRKLAFHSYCCRILYRFWDIARYWSKIAFFHTALHSTPPVRAVPVKYAMRFGTEKLEWWAYQTVKKTEKKFENMFLRFDGIHERDGQTDRQTDRQTDTARQHRSRLCTASRGKNYHKQNHCSTPSHLIRARYDGHSLKFTQRDIELCRLMLVEQSRHPALFPRHESVSLGSTECWCFKLNSLNVTRYLCLMQSIQNSSAIAKKPCDAIRHCYILLNRFIYTTVYIN